MADNATGRGANLRNVNHSSETGSPFFNGLLPCPTIPALINPSSSFIKLARKSVNLVASVCFANAQVQHLLAQIKRDELAHHRVP
jgi:hypothetical protein